MFIIEGNIGTGKTTFLTRLQKSLATIAIHLESVDYWQNESQGKSILEHFYNDPYRWGYTMETITLKMRIQEHLKLQNSKVPTIIERSIYSGYHCFARNSFEQGFLQQIEWNIYQAWFNFLTAQQCLPPRGFIYLRAGPKISYQRIQQRHRSAESSISLDYIEQIHAKHEAFLIDKTNNHPSIKSTPVLVLDANYDLLNDKKKLLNYIEQVQQFIHDNS